MYYYATRTIPCVGLAGEWLEIDADSLSGAKRQATKLFKGFPAAHGVCLVESSEELPHNLLIHRECHYKRIGGSKWESPEEQWG